MANSADTQFDVLMKEVLSNIGLPDLQATDTGIYSVTVDDNIAIHVACPDEHNVLVFSSVYEAEPDTITLQQTRKLLSLNEMKTDWAPTVWLSSDDRVIVWSKEPVDRLNQTNFLAIFKKFIEEALKIQALMGKQKIEPAQSETSTVANHLLGMKA